MFNWDHLPWTPRGLRVKAFIEATVFILGTIAVVVISGWQ
jgi:hypothetical protein